MVHGFRFHFMNPTADFIFGASLLSDMRRRATSQIGSFFPLVYHSPYYLRKFVAQQSCGELDPERLKLLEMGYYDYLFSESSMYSPSTNSPLYSIFSFSSYNIPCPEYSPLLHEPLYLILPLL